MKSLHFCTPKFIQLNNDNSKWLNYIVNMQKKLKKHFETLENNKKISGDEFKSICPFGTGLGILYGLPKVHKIVIHSIPKFRSRLAAIGTPVYKLAKFLIPILSALSVNDYTVKYQFSFAKEVIRFDHNRCLPTFL